MKISNTKLSQINEALEQANIAYKLYQIEKLTTDEVSKLVNKKNYAEKVMRYFKEYIKGGYDATTERQP